MSFNLSNKSIFIYKYILFLNMYNINLINIKILEFKTSQDLFNVLI